MLLYFYKKPHCIVLIIILLLQSCAKPKNVWIIQGNLKNHVNAPVFLSIRGVVDSSMTDKNGDFLFERVNQNSEFVKLDIHRNFSNPLHFFADSVCRIQISVANTDTLQNAEIVNSPESIKMKELQSWYVQQKHIQDSVVYLYKQARFNSNNADTLQIQYIEFLDSVYEQNYSFITNFISANVNSPVAATASFITFDTVTFAPILLSNANGLKYIQEVNKELHKRYGNIPFVSLYSNTLRSLELQNKK